MATKTVTRKDAEKVRAAITAEFNAVHWGGAEGILVQEPGHWSDGESWYVCWEEGPYEWTYRVPTDIVPGLFVEPYNTFVLAVCIDH